MGRFVFTYRMPFLTPNQAYQGMQGQVNKEGKGKK